MNLNKLLFTFLISLFILPLVVGTSESTNLPPIKQGKCMPLVQYCGNCTYVNITSIMYPNGSVLSLNWITKFNGGDTYVNNSFCDTSQLGTYVYATLGDPDGIRIPQPVSRDVTESGATFSLSQPILIIGQLSILALFYLIGISFSRERWKVKTFFFMMASLMGVIMLNTLRIMLGTSVGLAMMGTVGLIIGIVVLLFLFLYFFIYQTIEVFQYFKRRKEMRWQVSSQ